MNPPNLAFLQAMMTSMHPQPPLQALAGPGQLIPQQAGFPTFFLQAPQMQIVPPHLSLQHCQLGAQPWILPPLQTNTYAPQPSGFQSVEAPANAAGVATATKPTPQDAVRDKSIPVGSAPDDERILVNALRKAQAEGQTPLQAFSTLDKVSRSMLNGFLLSVDQD